jgi:hypothetical protein
MSGRMAEDMSFFGTIFLLSGRIIEFLMLVQNIPK